MKARRLLTLIAALGVVALALSVAYAYRYLVLSKLNVTTGDSETALGLRRLAEIPLAGGATRFDYQSIDPQRGLLFIAHLGDGQVIAFDLRQQKVAAIIPDVASAHGVAVAPETGRAYAAATGAHQVAVIDTQTFQVIARADGGDYPDGLAYDPDTQKVFVSDESGGGVIVIDARTNRRTGRIEMGGEVGNTHSDALAHRILSAAQGRNQLVAIDPKSETIVDRYDLPGCEGPHGFTLDSAARQAFVSCEANAKLLLLNLETKQITASDSVGDIPDVLAFDGGLHRLYVAAESGVVAVFQVRGAALQKTGQVYLAPNAHTIAVDAQTHRVYVPLENINGRPVLRVYEPLQTGP
jgi:DNA-binding beta-propeller fold protein YncE